MLSVTQRITYYNVSRYMKKVFFHLLMLVSIMIITSTGCSDDGDCSSGEVEVMDLADFGCSNPAFTVTVMTLNEFELIRDQEDFDLHVVAKCVPEIDWVEHDLIAGMIELPNGFTSIDKALIRNCGANELTLQINVKTNLTQVAPVVSFNAIIPKLRDEEALFVDFMISN